MTTFTTVSLSVLSLWYRHKAEFKLLVLPCNGTTIELETYIENQNKRLYEVK